MSLFKKVVDAPPRTLGPPDSATSLFAVPPDHSPTHVSGREVSSIDPVETDGESKPEAGAHPPTATDELFERLTRTATSFVKMAEDERVYLDTGEPVYTIAERLRAFETGTRWFDKVQRIRPVGENDAPGIELLKKIIASPEASQLLEDRGFIRLPDMGEQNNTSANKARRDRVKKLRSAAKAVAVAEDDNELAKLTRAIKTNGSPAKPHSTVRTPEHIAQLRAGNAAYWDRRKAEEAEQAGDTEEGVAE